MVYSTWYPFLSLLLPLFNKKINLGLSYEFWHLSWLHGDWRGMHKICCHLMNMTIWNFNHISNVNGNILWYESQLQADPRKELRPTAERQICIGLSPSRLLLFWLAELHSPGPLPSIDILSIVERGRMRDHETNDNKISGKRLRPKSSNYVYLWFIYGYSIIRNMILVTFTRYTKYVIASSITEWFVRLFRVHAHVSTLQTTA